MAVCISAVVEDAAQEPAKSEDEAWRGAHLDKIDVSWNARPEAHKGMTLRAKSLIAVSLTLIVLIMIMIIAISQLVTRGFSKLEASSVVTNVDRVNQAFDDELANMQRVALDWAQPGEVNVTVQTLVDFLNNQETQPNEDGSSQLATQLINLNLNTFVVADASKDIVWAREYNEDTRRISQLGDGILAHLDPGGLLLAHTEKADFVRGVILLPEDPMLVVSVPMVFSASGPIEGTIVMGRLLDSDVINDLGRLTYLELTIKRLTDELDNGFQDARNNLTTSGEPFVKPLTSDMVAGYTLRNDINGEPAFLMRAVMPRDIMREGSLTLRYLVVALVIIGIAIIILMVVLVDRLVLSRLGRLNDEVNKIKQSGNFDIRVNANGQDEISNVAGTINETMDVLAEAHEKLEQELEKGKRIQQDFLPLQLPQLPGWEIDAFLSPAREVAGDFYDAYQLPGGLMGLVIGDVCDKGVGSALFMALNRSLLRIFSGQSKLFNMPISGGEHSNGPDSHVDTKRATQAAVEEAVKAVERTNDYIAHTHANSTMFTTLFFGVLDPATGVLNYVNAGHEAPLIVSSARRQEFLRTTGPAVGVIPDVNYAFGEALIEPGDVLFTYTDGVTDSRNAEGESFTEKHLLSLLVEPFPSATELLTRIKDSVLAHRGLAEQFDDITMLVIRRKPDSAMRIDSA